MAEFDRQYLWTRLKVAFVQSLQWDANESLPIDSESDMRLFMSREFSLFEAFSCANAWLVKWLFAFIRSVDFIKSFIGY